MRVRVLDGADCVGGTKILLSHEGEGLLLDFGLCFATYGRFFEEFLRPRSSRGMADLLRMGVVPPLAGCYRTDLGSAETGAEFAKGLDVAGMLLSHAHQDHFGVAGTLRPDMPFHCSPTTMAILKSCQDTGRADFWAECAYSVPKADGGRAGVYRSAPTSTPALGRPFVVDGPIPAALASLMSSPPNPSSRARGLAPGSLAESDGRAGGFSYLAMPVDHSVPGAASFLVSAGGSRVLYSGDARFHGCRGYLTTEMVEKAAADPPDLLIVEGTRIGRKPGPEVTESKVTETAFDVVCASDDRLVVADYGSRHVERLASFLAVAKATDRKMVVTAKDMSLLEALWAAGDRFVDPSDEDLLVYDEARATTQGWESLVLDRCASRLVTPHEVCGDPGGFIVAFSFFDVAELVDIGVTGGVYIYSGSEAYSEDQQLDLYRLGNWLGEFGFEVHGFRWEGGSGGRAVFEEPLNASGHLSEEDLRWLLATIRARNVLPVHTEHPRWFIDVCKAVGSKAVFPDVRGEVSLH